MISRIPTEIIVGRSIGSTTEKYVRSGPQPVDGGGFFDLKRDRLDKADEHEDRKPRAEAEVDDGDRPRRIQRDQTKAAGGKVKIGGA